MRIKEEEGGPTRQMGALKRAVSMPSKGHMYTEHKGLVRETYMRHPLHYFREWIRGFHDLRTQKTSCPFMLLGPFQG
jgi:hypothetical protein